jgi:hypothetical protein
MNRDLQTVAQVWREYNYGLEDGVQVMSIKKLEEKFHGKWRSSASVNKYFSRRMVIVNYIKKMIEENMSGVDAVNLVEIIRLNDNKPLSLNKLSEKLKTM